MVWIKRNLWIYRTYILNKACMFPCYTWCVQHFGIRNCQPVCQMITLSCGLQTSSWLAKRNNNIDLKTIPLRYHFDCDQYLISPFERHSILPCSIKSNSCCFNRHWFQGNRYGHPDLKQAIQRYLKEQRKGQASSSVVSKQTVSTQACFSAR